MDQGDWVETGEGAGRPDWNSRDCAGMSALVNFALRYDLDESVSPFHVCKRVFIATTQIEKVDEIVDRAWDDGARSLERADLNDSQASASTAAAAARKEEVFDHLHKEAAASAEMDKDAEMTQEYLKSH